MFFGDNLYTDNGEDVDFSRKNDDFYMKSDDFFLYTICATF